jgi:sigma-B regulation protein RsbU (phosphoserine phosphatase)
LTGQIIGYDFGKSSEHTKSFGNSVGVVRIQGDESADSDDAKAAGADAGTPEEQAAEALARRALMQGSMLNMPVKLGHGKVTRNSDDPSRYDVVWDEHPAGSKDVTLHITASVRDSQVVAQRVETKVDNDHSAATPKVKTAFGIVYGFFLAFGAIYAIYRYVKRTLQKEVSHARTLVVAGLFAIFYGVLAYSLTIDQIAARIGGATFAKIQVFLYVGGGIIVSIMGLLVGIGYGSGEGELRETYPGKLTSLDALLSGRIFSRDVASSFLFGAAAAGWLVFVQHALASFFKTDITASQSHALTYTFAHYPWLSLVLGRQYDPLLIAVVGLLLPAAFLSRRAVRRHLRFASLILFALLSVLGDAAEYSSPSLAVMSMVVLASALLLPFFAFDLLAAIVSLSALALSNETIKLVEVVPSWTPLAWLLAALAAALLALAAYLAFNGRRVPEEDVRPRYARNLEERMSMQAEILAAREAQLRLLPQAAPELPGVELAACCLPARGVGGDFYDFFRLDANRLGIFVAQGGDEGLASALCIALAKGLLMHASQQSHSPTQIIEGLVESIAELLERGSGTGISFAYGVMDTRHNLLTYARIGNSPRLVIYRAGVGSVASSQMEREVNEPGRLTNAAPIFKGVAQAHPGDYLLFVTAGLMSLRNRRSKKHDYEWLPGLIRELDKPEEPLQSSLSATLAKYQKQAPDDLTAVVLRIVEVAAVQQEVVA